MWICMIILENEKKKKKPITWFPNLCIHPSLAKLSWWYHHRYIIYINASKNDNNGNFALEYYSMKTKLKYGLHINTSSMSMTYIPIYVFEYYVRKYMLYDQIITSKCVFCMAFRLTMTLLFNDERKRHHA